MLAVCVAVVSCSGHSDLTEYSLDESSFDAEAMAKIEQESGLKIPAEAKGLAFYQIPPIDPIIFAKIKMPAESQSSLVKQVETLTFKGTSCFTREASQTTSARGGRQRQ